MDSLEELYEALGKNKKILVENINYSPSFLEPFWKNGLCELCLDLGHLILGQEKVADVLKQYLSVTREIHLHGVNGYEEHLSLAVLPTDIVHKWLNYLLKNSFSGLIKLEVFSSTDLEESIRIIVIHSISQLGIMGTKPVCNNNRTKRREIINALTPYNL